MHTPGPWHLVNGTQIRSAKHQIAKVWMMRGSEGVANARLISAAPEMLEALVALHAVARVDRDEDYLAVTKAAAVIAKATGQPA